MSSLVKIDHAIGDGMFRTEANTCNSQLSNRRSQLPGRCFISELYKKEQILKLSSDIVAKSEVSVVG
jgi:hypothetical protein